MEQPDDWIPFPTGFQVCSWKCLVTLLGKTYVINRSNKATQVHLEARWKLHILWCSGDLIFFCDFFHPIPCPCLQSSCSVSCSFIVRCNWACSLPYFSKKKKICSVLFLMFAVIWIAFTKVLFSFVEIWMWHYAVSERGGLHWWEDGAAEAHPSLVWDRRSQGSSQGVMDQGLHVGSHELTGVTHPRCSEGGPEMIWDRSKLSSCLMAIYFFSAISF